MPALPSPPSPRDRQLARQARLAAVVIVATVVLWLGAQWLGSRLAWESRFAFLFDFAALGGFLFALGVTFRVWRARRDT